MTKKIISIGSHLFDVEVADTDKERTLGLMHRKNLGPKQGMMFIMKNEPAFFHMQNTEVPLDILFFNDMRKVTKIDQMEPHSGKSKCLLPTSYVVELPMGTCEELGIKSGDDMKVYANSEKKPSLRVERLLRRIINEVMR